MTKEDWDDLRLRIAMALHGIECYEDCNTTWPHLLREYGERADAVIGVFDEWTKESEGA